MGRGVDGLGAGVGAPSGNVGEADGDLVSSAAVLIFAGMRRTASASSMNFSVFTVLLSGI